MEHQISIDYLSYDALRDKEHIKRVIYPDMQRNYYWSDDFSPEYYIAQAKAGFIAVSELNCDELVILPEIQYSYALLDFKDLHISKKVKKVLKNRKLELVISEELEDVYYKLSEFHKRNWLRREYLDVLHAVNRADDGCQVVSVVLKEEGRTIAGEIGYIIGKTYTSLSGFSSKEKYYRNYGTVQIVLLVKYLEDNGFAFLNLGQPYMDYKLALGAKIYPRDIFLKRWLEAI